MEKVAKVMGDKYNVNVRFVGEKARADKDTIYLPALPEQLDERTEMITRGYCDHETGHIKYSDSLTDKGIKTTDRSDRLMGMTHIFEDIRIERLMGDRYLGVRQNLEAMANAFFKPEYLKDNAINQLAYEARRHVAGQKLRNGDFTASVKANFGVGIFDRIDSLTTSEDSFKLAVDVLSELEKLEGFHSSDDSASEESSSGNTGSMGESKKRKKKAKRDREEGEGNSEGSSSDMPVGESAEATFGREGKGGRILNDLDDMVDVSREAKEALEKANTDGLYDGSYMVYDKSMDKVLVMKEAATDHCFQELKKSLIGLDAARSRISTLFLTRTASRWIGGRDEGKIDSRSLARVAAGAKDVFKEKCVSRDRDTAVTFLVDFSGSMRGPAIVDAIRTVVLFLEMLNGARIKSEVLAYTTGKHLMSNRCSDNPADYGRVEQLLTYVIKAFDEPYNLTVKKRISNYRSIRLNQNCDPDSVMVAYERLAQRRERRKVMFVLTDGVVSNLGNNEAGRKYLKGLIPRLTKKGVEVIGVGVGHEGAGEVGIYYPKSVQVSDSKNLAISMVDQLKKTLGVK